MKKIRIIIGITTCIFTQNAYSKAIIWDLHFTLIKENRLQAVKSIGLKPSVLFGLQHGSKLVDIMENSILDVQKGYKSSNNSEIKNSELSLDTKGNPHPDLMHDWLASNKTCAEVRKIALEEAEKYDKYKPNSPLVNMFTKDNVHKKMVKGTFTWMFTPELYAQGQKVFESGRKLLKKCATFTDAEGKIKHQCYMLSNCDAETYAYLEKDPRFEPIFRYIKPENRFISGKLHCLKPQAKIYKHLLQEANLDPKDCILIDDQEENCKKAIELGMDAIELKKDNFTAVEKELRKRGIFEKQKQMDAAL